MACTGSVPSYPGFPGCAFRLREKVQERLQREGLRVEVDSRDEKIGYKIREAQMQKSRTCWWSVTKKQKTAR